MALHGIKLEAFVSTSLSFVRGEEVLRHFTTVTFQEAWRIGSRRLVACGLILSCERWEHMAGEKGRDRAVPPRVGLRVWLEPVDPGTLYIRRECRNSDSGAHPISEARMTKLVEELHGAGRV